MTLEGFRLSFEIFLWTGWLGVSFEIRVIISSYRTTSSYFYNIIIRLYKLNNREDPISVVVRQGAVKICEIDNNTPDALPNHIHQVRFQVVYRRMKDGGFKFHCPSATRRGLERHCNCLSRSNYSNQIRIRHKRYICLALSQFITRW